MNVDAVKLTTALAGVVIGWAGTALTLTGRVSAIEATLVRIEARLDNRKEPDHGTQTHPYPAPPAGRPIPQAQEGLTR